MRKDFLSSILNEAQIFIKNPLLWIIFYIFLIFIFAFVYQMLPENSFNNNFNNSIYLNTLYFSTVCITTLGFGDIYPVTNLAKVLVTTEVLLGVIFIGVFFNFLSLRTTERLEEIKRKEREIEGLPLRRIVFNEISNFLDIAVDTWKIAYQHTHQEETNLNLNNLFSDGTIYKIVTKIRIYDRQYIPNTSGDKIWGVYMCRMIDHFFYSGKNILKIHSERLDPDVYNLIHNITNQNYFLNQLFLGIERNMKNRVDKTLDECGIGLQGDFLDIIELIKWCDKESEYLEKNNHKVHYFPTLKRNYKFQSYKELEKKGFLR